MERFGLIGYPLGHSFSPQIHRRLGSWPYELHPLQPEELGPFLQAGEFSGLNVTLPYKTAVIPYCGELSPIARRIGSVNTILRRPDGTLYGHNTDYDGLRGLLEQAGLAQEFTDRKVLVLGSGGASLTARTVAQDLGAGEVVVISRSGPDHYGNLDRHADARFILNTTPVGMYPNTGKAPLDLKLFPLCRGVCDIVYNPARTQLMLDAQQLDIPAVGGLGMLVGQAKAAAELFLGKTLESGLAAAITREIRNETENMVLIGMPGCGKSTVGRALADRTGRRLVDIDQELEQELGCAIPDFFAQKGEAAFRQAESEMLARFCRESGLVIACGGGAVTVPENIDVMRQNGRLVYLRRPLEELPTEGRPVSQSRPLEELFAQRRPLYESAADLTVDNVQVEQAAADIWKEWTR
jgi:shikimate dehydrogenase